MTAHPIVIADNISKTFDNGVVALRNFSTRVDRGEVVVIVGPSGAGKSTFLRCLNGLEDIDHGSIVIDGIPLDDRPENRLEIRKEVGMVFQRPNPLPISIWDNIIFGHKIHAPVGKKVSKSEEDEIVDGEFETA